MVTRKYLFIEGTKDITNGNLREGFGKILEKKVKGNMPTISMGGGKKQTIDKFLNSSNSKLLCDLDAPESEKNNDMKQYSITAKEEFVFYMIQEMESWFISQSNIIDNFYNSNISTKLAKKPASEFYEPDKELQKLTKGTKKGSYHKVKHGSQLLKLLDPDKLYNDFPDFKRLIEKLK